MPWLFSDVNIKFCLKYSGFIAIRKNIDKLIGDLEEDNESLDVI